MKRKMNFLKSFWLLVFLVIITISCPFKSLFAQYPVYEWSYGLKAVNQLGLLDAYNSSVCADQFGNVYYAGAFDGMVIADSIGNAQTLTNSTNAQITTRYIIKLDSNGTKKWIRHIDGKYTASSFCGGREQHDIKELKCDHNGNIYILGTFEGEVDFNPGPGVYNLASVGNYYPQEEYIMKLDSSGNFLWAKSFKESMINYCGNNGEAKNFEFDSQGNIIVAGNLGYHTTDFDPSPSVTFLLSDTFRNFILKLDASGNFIWAKGMGNTNSYSYISDVTVDNSDNIYTTGHFSGIIDLDLNSGVAIPQIIGPQNVFIQKLDNNGNYLWSKSAADTVSIPPAFPNDPLGARGFNLSVDDNNNVHVFGSYWMTLYENNTSYDTLLYHSSFGNRSSAFVLVIDSSGNYKSAKNLYYRYLRGSPESKQTAIFKGNNEILFMASDDPQSQRIPALFSLDTNGGIQNILGWQKMDPDPLSNLWGSITSHDVAYINGNYYLTLNSQVRMDLDPGVDTVLSTLGQNAYIVKLKDCYPTFFNISDTVCGSYTYTSSNGAVTYTQSGTYYDTLRNSAGCDSIIILNLQINQASTATITVGACANSYTSPSNNFTWTSSGIYQDTISNQAGCDSILTINLNLGQHSYDSINELACRLYNSPSANHSWSTTGIYSDTIPNVSNCDSVITINLTVLHIDTTISQSNLTLTSNESGASYQWFECNPFTIIFGEINQSINVTSNGTYAVIIYKNGCRDTSVCISINNVGVYDISPESISVYPNPASDHFIIQDNKQSLKSIWVYTSVGQLVYEDQKNFIKTEIQTSNWAKGMYYLKIEKDNKYYSQSIVVE